jgi:hypothetical protein
MFRPDPLSEEFEGLKAMTDAHARGRQFEAFVERLRTARFRVHRNPGTARPRQTDLLATGGGRTYLIEVAWDSSPGDVDDVDSLRTRLEDTPADVVGVLVNVAGFSKNARKRVEAKRSRHVLLLDKDEIERVVGNPLSLPRLLRSKERHLLVHAKALLGESEPAPSFRADPGWPVTRTALVWPDGRREGVLRCGGDFGQFVFVQDVPDIDWASHGSFGVDLDVQFVTFDAPHLVRVMQAMNDLGWVTHKGHWSIQQAAANWHGFGIEAFVEGVLSWEKRYKNVERLHHTEQVIYQDTCVDGFYVLAADISASEDRAISYSEIALQLHGVPLDTAPFVDLCDLLDVDFPQYFRPRNKASVVQHGVRRGEVPVSPLAWVVEEDELEEDPDERDWVTGVVVENPFRGRGTTSARGAPDWWPGHLLDSEMLICALRSWHPLGRRGSSYALQRCELVEMPEALLVRLVADWADPLG